MQVQDEVVCVYLVVYQVPGHAPQRVHVKASMSPKVDPAPRIKTLAVLTEDWLKFDRCFSLNDLFFSTCLQRYCCTLVWNSEPAYLAFDDRVSALN